MNGNEPIILKTEKDFKNLIRPLRRQEYLALEQSLRSEGCREPILVWNGYIVDGHNRYAICQKYGIPFEIEEIEFICKEEAIAWICARQLKRKNITDEARKFLIGMQYETEKYVNHIKFPKGENHYTMAATPTSQKFSRQISPTICYCISVTGLRKRYFLLKLWQLPSRTHIRSLLL